MMYWEDDKIKSVKNTSHLSFDDEWSGDELFAVPEDLKGILKEPVVVIYRFVKLEKRLFSSSLEEQYLSPRGSVL